MLNNLTQDTIEKILIAGLTGIIAFFSTIAGIVISYFVNKKNLKIQYLLNTESTKIKLLYEKIEYLYIDFNKWKLFIDSSSLAYLKCMNEELTFNQVLDLEIQSGGRQNFDYSRIKMISNVYFPNLTKTLNEVHSKREKACNFVFLLKERYKVNKSSKDLMKPFNEAMRQFDQQCEFFLDEIIKEKEKI